MDLRFQSSYLSINAFPDISLPDLTIITGLNGVGKSHVLQAINTGHIKTDCAPNHPSDNLNTVRYFDWNNLIPQDSGIFTSDSLKGERVSLLNNFHNHRRVINLEPLRVIARQARLGQEYMSDPGLMTSLAPEDLNENSSSNNTPLFVALQNAIREIENQMLSFGDVNTRALIATMSAKLKKNVINLKDEDFLSNSVPSWGTVELFKQSFARLFVAYRDLKLSNMIAELRSSKGFLTKFLSEDEFLAENGPAPWDFVNTSIANAGLDFRINEPEPYDAAPFNPQLTKISTGVQIPFASLSSGEKILMSFAFCLYYSSDRRQLAACPKIILFDEIDAPLHPSMSKNLMDTIRKSLINDLDVKVIMTTHSPSTVALAPEESVYIMERDKPGLQKRGKSEALNILTFGVPTLAISFEGRRQVFVESPADAKNYDALYKVLKSRIASERSLEFISTGTRTPDGSERNTGCDVVKRLVTAIVNAGNKSVFGLIDWDGTQKSTERLFVLGEGVRNGLENHILDPLIVALMIVRDIPQHKADINIPTDVNYMNILLKKDVLQKAVDIICDKTLNRSTQNITKSKYLGGMELDVETEYLTKDDHLLEAALMSAFPYLKSLAKRQAGFFMGYIISTILTDYPQAIPIELEEVMKKLLNQPAH